MLLSVRAWWARARMPRCDYCRRLMPGERRRFREIILCDSDDCREQFELERRYGVT